ncbi:hypothetical protein ABKN59_004711 [Abortiporus biennis]
MVDATLQDMPPPTPPKDPWRLPSTSLRGRPSPPHPLAILNSPSGRIPTSRIPIPTYPLSPQPSSSTSDRRAEMEIIIDERIEEEHRAQLKLLREQELKRFQEEEDRRKRLLEMEMKFAAIAKRRKAEEERMAEEESHRTIEERRRLFREKGRVLAQQHQQWLRDQEKQAQALALSKQESRHRLFEERRNRPLNNNGFSFRNILTCWITIQKSDTTLWRRRFCRLQKDAMLMFKSAQVDSPLIDRIQLSNIVSIQEADDGLEDLRVLPHSFILHEKQEDKSFTILTDDEKAKETFISALFQLCNL